MAEENSKSATGGKTPPAIKPPRAGESDGKSSSAGKSTPENAAEPASRAAHAEGEWRHPQQDFHAQPNGFGHLWSLPFGLLGPLLGAALSLLLVFILMWVLKIVNVVFQSALVSLMFNSVMANLQWFFAAFLAIGYLGYFSRFSLRAALVLQPFSSAVGTTFFAWMAAWLLRAVGTMAGIGFLSQAGNALGGNLPTIFFIFLALGFVASAMRAEQSRVKF